MQWKQGNVEANDREENSEYKESIREVAIMALCGATADTSAQRSVRVHFVNKYSINKVILKSEKSLLKKFKAAV